MLLPQWDRCRLRLRACPVDAAGASPALSQRTPPGVVLLRPGERCLPVACSVPKDIADLDLRRQVDGACLEPVPPESGTCPDLPHPGGRLPVDIDTIPKEPADVVAGSPKEAVDPCAMNIGCLGRLAFVPDPD